MNLWSILARASSLWPRRVAIADGELHLTYAELESRVRALAAYLRARGIAPGDRVAILEPNSCAFLEAYFAAAALGAILCPLNFRLSAAELALFVKDCGARVILAHSSFAELLDALVATGTPLERVLWTDATPPRALALAQDAYSAALAGDGTAFEPALVAPDAIAHLYSTSGTTGVPKAVMLTHRNVSAHALGTIAELRLSETDAWGHFAPMFHLADAWAVFAITWVGGRHVFVPRFEEAAVLDAIEKEQVTLTNLIPTMLNRLVRFEGVGARDFASLRLVLSGGAPIAPAVVRRVMDTFRCEYVQTYGMTETSPYLTLSLLKEHLQLLSSEDQFRFRAKTGRPFIAVEVEVFGDDGRPVPRDARTIGEIRARGETVTPGYWNRPEETARAFRDGWLCTGDLATIDEEGYLDIVDRAKDVIITGGEKVYSTEVEHVLSAHPAVVDAAVFGAADELWGESVRAAVVRASGATPSADELIAFCRERLTRFKVPRAIVFVAELPRTGAGKVHKPSLRELHGR